MTWLELSVEADRESVEPVSELFARIGYNSGVVVDEPLIPGRDGPDYQIDRARPVLVRTYLSQQPESDEQAAALVERAEQGLWALRMIGQIGELVVRELKEEDWANAWKAYYHPQRVGRHLVIVPSWEEFTPAPEDIVLQLDPGMAFGTGLHPSTQLCLQLIERAIRPGQEVLDLGSGSGILTIALARLGARVLALDNDPIAVEATRQNVEQNGVGSQVVVGEGSLGAGADFGHWMGGGSAVAGGRTEAEARFDVIVANILAKVHVALAGDYRRALRASDEHGGMLITAGIIAEREPEVAASLEQAGFQLVERLQDGDWVAFVHRIEA